MSGFRDLMNGLILRGGGGSSASNSGWPLALHIFLLILAGTFHCCGLSESVSYKISRFNFSIDERNVTKQYS